MSWEAVAWAVKVLEHQSHADMDTGPRFVLLIMANRANEEGELFPSVRWIMERTKYSERSVRNFIREILSRGLMRKQPRLRDDGGQSSNIYRLAMDQYVLRLIPPGATDAPGLATVAPWGAEDAGEGVQQPQGVGATGAPQETLRKRQKGKNSLGDRVARDDIFETAWAKYPARSGNNPKIDARKAWIARTAEGVDPATMVAGLQRYIRWVSATQKLGTEHVLRASTFFGPSKPYEQDFALPAAPGKVMVPFRLCAEFECIAEGKYPFLGKLYCIDHFNKHNDDAPQPRRNPVAELAASLVKPI